MKFSVLKQELLQHADSEKAVSMKAYMRHQFEYLGIPKPLRAALCKPYFKEAKKDDFVDWDFVEECWRDAYREFQYVAVAYLQIKQPLLTSMDIPLLKKLAITKSWWDTIDGLDTLIGEIALGDPQVNQVLLSWSADDNFWLRRIAIDHQLKRKEKTDTELLAAVIKNNLGQTEFFINKAIGWSLREYSKTDPNWVRGFIDEHRDQMASLSIREGSKYI